MFLPDLRSIPSPNYSSRGGQAVRLIVVHDCEGSFSGSISWFQQAKSRVSAHIVLNEDGTQVVQMVSWENKAWHACDFNPYSEGIEAAGYASKGLGAPEWQALARIVAFRLHMRGLPPVRAVAGKGAGFEQHVGLGAAGGGHHDITSNPAVWAAFEDMVRLAYADPEMPGVWGYKMAPAPIGQPPADWVTPTGTVRHGTAEGSLEWVQLQLNAARIPSFQTLTVDGLDGPLTRQALVRFQRLHNLSGDGVITPATLDALKQI